jgi:tRNA 5-methylaminomethyl-2-thiouridine biosynthesis bifunctional protein
LTEPRIIVTEDDSRTVFLPDRGIHYRSVFGALGESRHVFLGGSGLLQKPTPWRILELGFGTGLNFLTTAEAFLAVFDDGLLDFHTVDWRPLSPEFFRDLGYEQWVQNPDLLTLVEEALALGQVPRDDTIQVTGLNGRIRLTLYPWDWREIPTANLQVDAVYHDPFGPDANPDSWSVDCFRWSSAAMTPQARLATYGASTRTRIAMTAAGLYLARPEGYGKKREMTVAALSPEPLQGLRRINRDKYLGRLHELKQKRS